jgi:hypothetical protein
LPGGWLALTGRGLVEVPDASEARTLGLIEPAVDQLTLEWVKDRCKPALHTCVDGRFAAVVNDYGRYGAVVDLMSGSIVLTVDRGDYHVEQTPFPVAFLYGGQRTVVAAATTWNRLDAFDPATGRLLTDRVTTWTADEPRPDHALDYFHGALHPSPDGHWLLDDGWAWHPTGVPLLIDAAAWLTGQVYAAEYGRPLTSRVHGWDQPAVWIDNDTIALQRIGDDDDQMIDGVQLFDAPSGRRTGMFAGPAGPMWAHQGMLYISTAAGLEVWDPARGARTGLVADFTPTAHNPAGGTFAKMTGNALRTWRPGK